MIGQSPSKLSRNDVRAHLDSMGLNSDSDDESNSSGANETLKEGQNNKSFSDKKEGKCVCGCGGTREPGGCLVCKRPTELAPGLQDANSLVSDISVAQLESP